jgi:hypothetical protein
MKRIMVSGKNKKQYFHFLILILLSVILCNGLFSQKSEMKSNLIKIKSANKLTVVRLKTTITPRKGEVAFLGKAMEVIITPVDELNNEIISIPDGLSFKLCSNAPNDFNEPNIEATRTLYGKHYTYPTPSRIHDLKNNNELQIGAFLLKSDGLPDSTTGNFAKILVIDHIPERPDTTTFKVFDAQYCVDITNYKLKLYKKTDKYVFSWGAAKDPNNNILIKSFRVPWGQIYSINDTCIVKYKLKIKEYDFPPFPIDADTSTNIILTGDQLGKVMTYVKGSKPSTVKSVFIHWYIIYEDGTYVYAMVQYSDILKTNYKNLELYDDGIYANGANPLIPVTGFLLEQNYPNPFNPATNISYYLDDKCFVNLKVYDGIGRERATLVNQIIPRGKHTVYFNANGLPTGAYFYRLQAGNYSEIKRMLYLK